MDINIQKFDYIGKIYSEFKTIENMPLQGQEYLMEMVI